MENIVAGRIEQTKDGEQLIELFPALFVAVGTAVGQIVDVGSGFGCDVAGEPIGRSSTEDALGRERKGLPVLQKVHHDAGVQQHVHTAFSRSSRASSKVIVAGTLPNRDSTVSSLFW